MQSSEGGSKKSYVARCPVVAIKWSDSTPLHRILSMQRLLAVKGPFANDVCKTLGILDPLILVPIWD